MCRRKIATRRPLLTQRVVEILLRNEPIFDDDYDEYEDEDEYDNEYEDDEYYQTDDHDKTNIGVKPPQKEDINELYFNLLNEKNDEDDYDNSDYDDDEVWQF